MTSVPLEVPALIESLEETPKKRKYEDPQGLPLHQQASLAYTMEVTDPDYVKPTSEKRFGFVPTIDYHIHFQGIAFGVHRDVLASESTWFRALFLAAEKDETPCTLLILKTLGPSVTGETLELILQTIYTFHTSSFRYYTLETPTDKPPQTEIDRRLFEEDHCFILRPGYRYVAIRSSNKDVVSFVKTYLSDECLLLCHYWSL
jgi:hypothetical protein